nr:hypothetical protein [Streptococcus lutetiensis]
MMKAIKILGVTLLFGLLSGCGIISEATYDTAGAIKTESSKAYQSEEEQLNVKDILVVNKDEVLPLENHFSGTVYIMFTKEDLKKGLKTDFLLNDKSLTDVKEDSQDDFNIRYHKKTYFSAKKITVENLDQIKMTSTWPDDIVLSLRSK